jgi:hypothetical protein
MRSPSGSHILAAGGRMAKKKKARQARATSPEANRKRQLLVGTLYDIFQKFGANPETRQGVVFVESLLRAHPSGTGSLISGLGTVEHYSLFSSYRAPQATGEQTSIRFNRSALYRDFLAAHLPTSRYIQSLCLEGLAPPPAPALDRPKGRKK